MLQRNSPQDTHTRRRVIRPLCFALFAVITAVAAIKILLPSPSQSSPDGPTQFMRYTGPVMPLLMGADAPHLTVRREIDFSPAAQGQHPPSSLLVTDTYHLSLRANRDETLEVFYPVASSFFQLNQTGLPTVSLDGRPVNLALYPGQTTISPESWQGYEAILADTQDLQDAVAPPPDLTRIPVVVYAFSNPDGPPRIAQRENPSIRVSFPIDETKTTLLSYGFHGMSREEETLCLGFSIPQPSMPDNSEHFYLIVLGEDIGPYTLQGFADMGWDQGEEMDATVEVQRFESDLDTMLRLILDQDRGLDQHHPSGYDPYVYFTALAKYLQQAGYLSQPNGAMDCFLEDILSHVTTQARIFYLCAQIALPDSDIITLTARLEQQGSFDFYNGASKNLGVYGYDLLTHFGDAAIFSEQTLTLRDLPDLTILRDNLGLEAAAGQPVRLDISQSHYYFECKS